jgi:SAM-dependent methyltransferase
MRATGVANCKMNDDDWLSKWLDLLRQHCGESPLLELGCGDGQDTIDLITAGCRVVSTDISFRALKSCADRSRRTQLVQMDISQPFPFQDGEFRAVIGSLSLHYFEWEQTRKMFAEIKRCTQVGGIAIARFNSTKDTNFGANASNKIGPNYYRVGDRMKRFFDRDAVLDVLREWNISFIEESTIHRYEEPKVVWEVLAYHGA